MIYVLISMVKADKRKITLVKLLSYQPIPINNIWLMHLQSNSFLFNILKILDATAIACGMKLLLGKMTCATLQDISLLKEINK